MVTLVILDGFGYSRRIEGNAIALQGTPCLDTLDKYPKTLIEASGRAVGLVDGQMGNSEVGHLNLGAGRVVYQDMLRIDNAIEDKTFFSNKEIVGAIEHAKKNGSALHLMGLLSDGGVHSHINHLKALIDMASQKGLSEVYIHAITDGRDTYRSSATSYIKDILAYANGRAKLADVCGRVYAMDREKRYDRVQKAYNLYVYGECETESVDIIKTLEDNYKKEVYDEFFEPIVVDKNGRIKDNDSVIFFNYRTDRAREITEVLTQKAFNAFETKEIKNLYYCCMTEYSDSFEGVHVAFAPEIITDNLSYVISKAGLKQFHTTETTKYAHVTFFFNGGIEQPYVGEVRKLVDTINVKNFADFPRMKAAEITENAVKAIESGEYGFVLVNLSNPDMVGHTGDLEATKQAIEEVDRCATIIANATLKMKGDCIITADHGNAEEMIDEKGNVVTSHTTNPVPLWLVSEKYKNVRLITDGKLANIAPTILKMLNIEAPKTMDKPLF